MPTAKSEPEILVRRGKAASAVIETQAGASLVYHRFLSHPQERTLGKGNPLLSPQICANAVILFADLRGYTRICEVRSGPSTPRRKCSLALVNSPRGGASELTCWQVWVSASIKAA